MIVEEFDICRSHKSGSLYLSNPHETDRQTDKGRETSHNAAGAVVLHMYCIQSTGSGFVGRCRQKRKEEKRTELD